MASDLHEFLSRDHERLDALLADAVRDDGSIREDRYVEFRRGLLTHIGIEERLLFPEIRRRRALSEVEQQLHRDHAALAALLMPPPTRAEIESIRKILEDHNRFEEDAGGVYELVEEMTGEKLSALMENVRAYPPVALAPHADSEVTRRSIEQLVREADEGRRKLLRR
jgi:hemerythrin superfamily protein